MTASVQSFFDPFDRVKDHYAGIFEATIIIARDIVGVAYSKPVNMTCIDQQIAPRHLFEDVLQSANSDKCRYLCDAEMLDDNLCRIRVYAKFLDSIFSLTFGIVATASFYECASASSNKLHSFCHLVVLLRVSSTFLQNEKPEADQGSDACAKKTSCECKPVIRDIMLHRSTYDDEGGPAAYGDDVGKILDRLFAHSSGVVSSRQAVQP